MLGGRGGSEAPGPGKREAGLCPLLPFGTRRERSRHARQEFAAEVVASVAKQRRRALGREKDMGFSGNALRGAAVAVAMMVAATAAGCTGGTATSASAHPVAATAGTGAGAAGPVPPVFAASLSSIPPKPDSGLGDRLALLSS